MYVCMYVCMHACTHARRGVCVCMYVLLYVCMNVCIYVCVCTHVFTKYVRIYVRMHAFRVSDVYESTYMYICMCVLRTYICVRCVCVCARDMVFFETMLDISYIKTVIILFTIL
jgi:hypothetical protein